MKTRRHVLSHGIPLGLGVIGLGMAGLDGGPVRAEERDVIETRVNLALMKMYGELPETRELANRAKAMLVMPDVVKGGVLVGASYGEGALLLNRPGLKYDGPIAGFYSVGSASFGLQVGVQSSNHVLFFMTDDAVIRFRTTEGWEIGVDAEVTFPDAGLIAQINSTLLNKPVIGVVFRQDGILIGASLEGAKYSPIRR